MSDRRPSKKTDRGAPRATRGRRAIGFRRGRRATRHGSILYVDRDPDSRQLLVELVAMTSGRDIVIVPDEADALRSAQHLRPAVVVVSPSTGDNRTLDLVRRLRQHRSLGATPVVVISADVRPATRQAFTDLGVTAFLAKPVDLTVLADLLERLAPSPDRSLPPVVRRAS